MKKQNYDKVKSDIWRAMQNEIYRSNKTTRQRCEDIFNYAYACAYAVGKGELNKDETAADSAQASDRLRIAARAIQGILSNPSNPDPSTRQEREYIIKISLSLADELIAAAATDKTKTKTK